MGQEYGGGVCAIRNWNDRIYAQKMDAENLFAWSHDGYSKAEISGFSNLRDPCLAKFPRLCKDGILKTTPPDTIHSDGFF